LRVPLVKIDKNYDLIIVGAGICGLTLIDRLLEKKFQQKILVLESGSMLSNDPYPDQIAVKSTNLEIKKTSRYFGVGGGSNVWGPLHGLMDKDKIDYHFSNSEFPISYSQYIKYINIASEKYATPNSSMFKTFNKDRGSLKPRKIIRNNKKLNFFSFSSLLESNSIDFVENVTAEKIKFTRSEDIVVIKCKKTKTLHEVSGKYVILSSGTLENIKILCNSINNRNSDIGRGFMNHPKGMIGFFKSKKPEIESYTIEKIDDNFSSYTGLQIKSHKYLNTYLKVTKGLHLPFFYKLNYLVSDITLTNKNFLIQFISKCLLKLISIITKIILKFTMNNYFSIEVFCELEKNYDNLVRLSKDRLIVDYKMSERCITEVLSLLKEFETQMKVKISPSYSRNTLYKKIKRDSSHHMGGLSMGNNHKNLVDNKLKFKSSNNTYITGGSTFNFSDSVNPSLSYIALSIYLGDYLNEKLNEGC